MSTITLQGRLPGHHKFARPLSVIVQRDGTGHCYAYHQDILIFGDGPTRGEAIASFKRLLVAESRSLAQEEGKLSDHLSNQLQHLRQIVTWRHTK